jgi:chemotaxis-related protein WspD
MTDDVVDMRAIDACWNRIGTRGDGSCPQLATHARCLNCDVFARGAAALLDRPLSTADLAEAARDARAGRASSGALATALAKTSGVEGGTHSSLVFRVADEWLALPTSTLRQIEEIRPIHSLPHRRNRVVLGLVNIRGALTVAASLAELLHLERTQPDPHAQRSGYARVIVTAHHGEPVAFPVDEVEGVLRFAESAILPVPATLAHTAGSHVRGVVAWRDTTIGLLDPDRLFEALLGSLR